MMKRIALTLLVFLSFNYSRADQYIEIYNLEESWFFNLNDKTFPYVKGNNIYPEAIHFDFNFDRFAGKYLIIEHENPFAVFIDGKLIFASENKNVLWNIDSLGSLYYKTEVLFSIFSKDHNYDNLRCLVTKKSLIDNSPNEILKNETRTKYDRSDSLVIILVLLIALAVILNNNSKSFQEFYSLNLILIGRVKDDSVYKLKLFSPANLSLFLFHSAVLSFLIILIDRYAFTDMVNQVSFTRSVVVNWISLTLLIQFFFFLKYFIIRYIGSLFDIGAISNYYFYEYMRMSMVFFIFVLGIISFSIISLPYLIYRLSDILIYTTLIFMILRFIILFTRIGKQATFKNVHLFSYLCTTELVPIIIGVKYLIF